MYILQKLFFLYPSHACVFYCVSFFFETKNERLSFVWDAHFHTSDGPNQSVPFTEVQKTQETTGNFLSLLYRNASRCALYQLHPSIFYL